MVTQKKKKKERFVITYKESYSIAKKKAFLNKGLPTVNTFHTPIFPESCIYLTFYFTHICTYIMYFVNFQVTRKQENRIGQGLVGIGRYG